MKINPALQFVKEVKETFDLNEVVRLLSTGEWIAANAIQTGSEVKFSLGRVGLVQEGEV